MRFPRDWPLAVLQPADVQLRRLGYRIQFSLPAPTVDETARGGSLRRRIVRVAVGIGLSILVLAIFVAAIILGSMIAIVAGIIIVITLLIAIGRALAHRARH